MVASHVVNVSANGGAARMPSATEWATYCIAWAETRITRHTAEIAIAATQYAIDNVDKAYAVDNAACIDSFNTTINWGEINGIAVVR